MEAVTSSQQDSYGPITRGCQCLKSLPNKFCDKTMEIARKTKKLGQDDPRRIVHSLKVGLALTLVSLFYCFKPLYDGFGDSAMWAVLTDVVVLEFSVGATLRKGLNRMLATLVAGGLGFGAHCLATLSGRKGEPILIATFVFIIAAIMTFMRFFPKMKARYDYGLLIFILTFCLVSVSGYRNDQVLEMAITAFGDEYFKVYEESNENNKSRLQGYKSVLICKSSEETMANFARWEPGHGPFGSVIHGKCTSKSETLLGNVLTKLKPLTATLTVKSRLRQKSVTKSKRRAEGSVIVHIESSKKAAEELKSVLKTNMWAEAADLLEIIPAASVASLLLEIVECTEKIYEAVNELGEAASFRKDNATVLPQQPDSIRQETVQQDSNTVTPVPHCVIVVAE
ncbi:Aluminum-activated malate transporter 7 [Hibiscus syriacus]|uniref:Aluminum-activated malate transporter 7 n=1 Tax=Hibiscus syriacus TaxID=106335 RepID=A0A6A3ANM9_HIBSY|nr:Aluminum-activated malate transporter 7 [Hibiscus syriacus]